MSRGAGSRRAERRATNTSHETLPPSSSGNADHTDRSFDLSAVMPGIHSSGPPSIPPRLSTVMHAHGAPWLGRKRRVVPRRLNRLDRLAMGPDVVVALNPVLDHHLPIPGRLESLRRNRDEFAPRPRRDQFGEPGQLSDRVSGVAGEVHDHEPLPHGKADLGEAGTVEVGAVGQGCPDQRTVQSECPSMVWADEGRCVAGTIVDDIEDPRWAQTLASARISPPVSRTASNGRPNSVDGDAVAWFAELICSTQRQPRRPRTRSTSALYTCGST